MSCTNVSLADLQYIIEEKDLYVNERELISQDEWLEQVRKSLIEVDERPEKVSSSEEGLSMESDEESEVDDDDEKPPGPFAEKSRSVLTLLSKFDEYKAECFKYMIAPCSMMSSISEITHLNLEVHHS